MEVQILHPVKHEDMTTVTVHVNEMQAARGSKEEGFLPYGALSAC